jgi:hypothetical protein
MMKRMECVQGRCGMLRAESSAAGESVCSRPCMSKD